MLISIHHERPAVRSLIAASKDLLRDIEQRLAVAHSEIGLPPPSMDKLEAKGELTPQIVALRRALKAFQ